MQHPLPNPAMLRNIFSPGSKTSRDLNTHSLWCQYKILMNAKVHCNKRSTANLMLLPISKSRAKRQPVPGLPSQTKECMLGSLLPIALCVRTLPMSIPCSNRLGAQPGPQGTAIARRVLPRQSRGYGSGSLRHLEKNRHICCRPVCPTIQAAICTPERSPPSTTLILDLQLISH